MKTKLRIVKKYNKKGNSFFVIEKRNFMLLIAQIVFSPIIVPFALMLRKNLFESWEKIVQTDDYREARLKLVELNLFYNFKEIILKN